MTRHTNNLFGLGCYLSKQESMKLETASFDLRLADDYTTILNTSCWLTDFRQKFKTLATHVDEDQ